MRQMYNITLVGTIHSESGQCNSDELYKILEGINPEVIFDELPVHFAEMYFSDSFELYCANKSLQIHPAPTVPLEVKCIKKYMQNHSIEIVPVDIDIRKKMTKHQQEFFSLFQIFFRNEEYIKLDAEKDALIASEDFRFLNSDKFSAFLEKKEVMEKSLIESDSQRERLLEIYKLFHAENCDNRENEMLKNIYNYSKANPYNQAVFFVGAQHKKSLMGKIEAFEKDSGVKLNWTMYGN